MESHYIISVKIVLGTSLNPGWKRGNMQIIQTDKGLYIDNVKGNQFGFFKDASPGYDWGEQVGNKVGGIRVFNDQGYQWLNKKS